MAKNKKKKKKQDSAATAVKVTKRLREMTKNPLVADIVAATLVAAAAALKDSKKAQRLAADAGKDLEELAGKSAQRGNVMWQLALDVGRQSLEALTGEDAPKARKSQARPKAKAKAKAKPKAKAKAASAGSGKAKSAAASRAVKAPRGAKSKSS